MSDNDRRRPLRDEEQALWEAYTRPLKPLRRRQPAPAPVKPRPPPAEQARSTRGKAAAAKTPSPPPPPPLTPLDRRTRTRVARGHTGIDRRLDLHGLTKQEAHSALLHFLRQSVAREARTVLVITGKSGVLRREVPQWLALPDFRALLIGFEQAAIRHGGEGALYLRLRKSR
jgi:DNA-nicking Smr family endonuclease